MLARVTSLLILTVLLGSRANADEPAAKSPSADGSFTFAAFGDLPYDEDEFPLLRRQLAELKSTIPFIFHVGDIKRSTVPFREDAYSRVADELKKSPVPVFITLGDNEYTDAADPVLALSYWKKYFGNLHDHWKHGLDLQIQSQRRENVAFVHRGVLFIMIHLVGGDGYDRTETAARMNDNVEWLKTHFERSGESARAAVIIAHAHAVKNRKPIGDTLISLGRKFGKPILYIHGDGHRWIQNQPFGLRNITRIQVDQGGIAPPLLVTVKATDADDDFFTFERNLTDEYNRRREIYNGLRAKKASPKAAAQ